MHTCQKIKSRGAKLSNEEELMAWKNYADNLNPELTVHFNSMKYDGENWVDWFTGMNFAILNYIKIHNTYVCN